MQDTFARDIHAAVLHRRADETIPKPKLLAKRSGLGFGRDKRVRPAVDDHTALPLGLDVAA